MTAWQFLRPVRTQLDHNGLVVRGWKIVRSGMPFTVYSLGALAILCNAQPGLLAY